MLQTYEAVLDRGQIRWVDAAPMLPSAQLWITVQPPKSSQTSASHLPTNLSGMIASLVAQPVALSQDNQFFTREQANGR